MAQTIMVTYASQTGNTKQVAEAIADELGVSAVAMAEADPSQAECIAVGFWVHAGKPCEEATRFLESLAGKKVFLFGTMGTHPSEEHAILSSRAARDMIAERNLLLGQFVCQGKLADTIHKEVTTLVRFPYGEPVTLTREMMADSASHPDAADLEAARKEARKAFAKVRR